MVIDANNENGINDDTDIHGSHDINVVAKIQRLHTVV